MTIKNNMTLDEVLFFINQHQINMHVDNSIFSCYTPVLCEEIGQYELKKTKGVYSYAEYKNKKFFLTLKTDGLIENKILGKFELSNAQIKDIMTWWAKYYQRLLPEGNFFDFIQYHLGYCLLNK